MSGEVLTDPRRVLGDYELREPLGHGGMATVFRAVHRESGEAVALKTVDLNDERFVQGIRREVRALARLRHPGIVRVVADGVHDGVPWYAMELIAGRTLGQLTERPDETQPEGDRSGWWTRTLGEMQGDPIRRPVRSPEAVALPELLTIARALCDSLAYLHGEGLVHRDLKPDNIIVRDGTDPVLVDFGLASVRRRRSSREALEARWDRAGTASYMAPEAIRGEIVDARADLYALGCILYELATGTKPFSAFTPQAVLQRHLEVVPQPPSTIDHSLPRALDELVMRLLEKNPRDRIGHADDVARALEALGARPSDTPRPPARDYLYRPGFVGRERSRAELEEALRTARRGEGSFVLVSGESGIGKTRLVNQLGGSAARSKVLVLEGSCPPTGSTPLATLRLPLEHLADRCLARGPDEARRVFGGNLAVLSPYAPALDKLPLTPERVSITDPALWRLRLFDALGSALAAVAEEQPVLLVLDDLQWADELTHDLLGHLAREVLPSTALMVVATARSEEIGDGLWRLLSGPVENMELDRLDESDLRALTADMLAHEPPPSLVAYLQQHSEGNPFFAAEYLLAALDEGLLRRDSQGRWELQEIEGGELAIPLSSTLRELVQRRIRELSPAAAALCAAASVVGDELDLGLASQVAELDEGVVFGAVDELLRRQVLVFRSADGLLPGGEGASTEGSLRFAHHKLREAAYAAIPEPSRRELHLRAATVIDEGGRASSVMLAHHWLEAGDHPRALDALDETAVSALQRSAYRSAADAFRTALDIGSVDDRRRPSWEQGLAEAHLGLGAITDGRRHLVEASRLRGLLTLEGPLDLALGIGSQVLRQVSHRLSPRPPGIRARSDALTGTRIYQRLVETYWFANDAPRMLACGLAALNTAERAGLSPELVRAYATMSLASSSAPAISERYARLALDAAERVRDPSAEIYARFLVSVARVGRGAWAMVDGELARAIERSRAIGDTRFLGESLTVLAMSHLYRGDFEEAKELFAKAGTNGRRIDNRQHRVWAALGEAEANMRLHREGRACRRLDEAAELLAGVEGVDLELFRLHGLWSQWHLRRRELAKARAAADRAATHGAVVSVPNAHYLLEGYAGVLEARIATQAAPEELAASRRAMRLFAALFPIGRPRAASLSALESTLAGRPRAAERARRRASSAAERLAMTYEVQRARGVSSRS